MGEIIRALPKYFVAPIVLLCMVSFVLLVGMTVFAYFSGNHIVIADWRFGRAEGPAPTLKWKTNTQAFSNVVGGGEIPGSSGAVLCALTFVDDDSEPGWCRIDRDGEGRWLMRTGQDDNYNSCEATCLHVSSTSQ